MIPFSFKKLVQNGLFMLSVVNLYVNRYINRSSHSPKKPASETSRIVLEYYTVQHIHSNAITALKANTFLTSKRKTEWKTTEQSKNEETA
jgi:hypothetical protein